MSEANEGSSQTPCSTSPWRSLRYDPPRKDSSFVVATDGRWIRGERGNRDCIVLDFLKDHQVVLELGSWELEGRYWMEVPLHLLPNKGKEQ
jgi:hypothetical protein